MKKLLLKNLFFLAIGAISSVSYGYCDNSQPYPAGSYIESCRNIGYDKTQLRLVANCSDGRGSSFRSEIDGYSCEKMSGRVDNSGGNLIGVGLVPGGSWSGSCHSAVYQFGSMPILSASCENRLGHYVYSQIIASPGDALSNNNGHLYK